MWSRLYFFLFWGCLFSEVIYILSSSVFRGDICHNFELVYFLRARKFWFHLYSEVVYIFRGCLYYDVVYIFWGHLNSKVDCTLWFCLFWGHMFSEEFILKSVVFWGTCSLYSKTTYVLSSYIFWERLFICQSRLYLRSFFYWSHSGVIYILKLIKLWDPLFSEFIYILSKIIYMPRSF